MLSLQQAYMEGVTELHLKRIPRTYYLKIKYKSYQEIVYCCGSTFTIKLKTILFLVAQGDFQRSQAEIFATDRKFFGTTIKSHWGVGSVSFSFLKLIVTGVPSGKIDFRCAHRGDHSPN